MCLSYYEAEDLKQRERHRALDSFSDSMDSLVESIKLPGISIAIPLPMDPIHLLVAIILNTNAENSSYVPLTQKQQQHPFLL